MASTEREGGTPRRAHFGPLSRVPGFEGLPTQDALVRCLAERPAWGGGSAPGERDDPLSGRAGRPASRSPAARTPRESTPQVRPQSRGKARVGKHSAHPRPQNNTGNAKTPSRGRSASAKMYRNVGSVLHEYIYNGMSALEAKYLALRSGSVRPLSARSPSAARTSRIEEYERRSERHVKEPWRGAFRSVSRETARTARGVPPPVFLGCPAKYQPTPPDRSVYRSFDSARLSKPSRHSSRHSSLRCKEGDREEILEKPRHSISKVSRTTNELGKRREETTPARKHLANSLREAPAKEPPKRKTLEINPYREKPLRPSRQEESGELERNGVMKSVVPIVKFIGKEGDDGNRVSAARQRPRDNLMGRSGYSGKTNF